MRTSMESPTVILNNNIGAEIKGFDLRLPLTNEQVSLIRSALLHHLVVVFRQQDLTPGQQAAFAKSFGNLMRHDFVPGLEENPYVIAIQRDIHHIQNFGGIWHSDNSYLKNPPMGSILHAIEIPEIGGDTIWSNQYLAYGNMPCDLKRKLSCLNAWHSAKPAFGNISMSGAVDRADSSQSAGVLHPLIRHHPETGRQSLFHSGPCTMQIDGWPLEESSKFLAMLLEYATDDSITYRHRWQKGDVVFWDNRCTMHVAVNDYFGKKRVVHRVSIA